MSLRRDYDESQYFYDLGKEEELEDLPRRKQIRRKIEDQLEKKRLRDEFDELDGEFDWDELDK